MHDRTAGWLGGLGTGVALTLLFGKDGPTNRTVVRDRLTRYGRTLRDKARTYTDEKGSANAWLIGVASAGAGLLAYGLIRMAEKGEQFADVTRSLEEFVEGELSPEEDRTPGEHANQYVNAESESGPKEDANFEFSGDSAATQISGIASGLAPDTGAAPEEGEAAPEENRPEASTEDPIRDEHQSEEKRAEIPSGLTVSRNSGAGTAEDEASGAV